jgi:hypothetical protein
MLTYLGTFVVVATVGLGLWLLVRFWGAPLFRVTVAGLFALGISVMAFLRPEVAWISPERVEQSFLRRLGIAVFGFFGCGIHLLFFDPLFLRRGSVRRLLSLQSPGRPPGQTR